MTREQKSAAMRMAQEFAAALDREPLSLPAIERRRFSFSVTIDGAPFFATDDFAEAIRVERSLMERNPKKRIELVRRKLLNG